MIVMKESSSEFIKKNMPALSDAQHPNDILEPLYDLIMEKGFVSHSEGYNAFGEEAQAVYDDIFYSNFD